MIKKIFNITKIAILARFKGYMTCMEPLTISDMKFLNFHQSLDNFTFKTAKGNIVNKNLIYLYGDIDFNNETDLKFLERYNKEIFNSDSVSNQYYSTFDYDKGIVTSNPNKDTPNHPCFMRYDLHTDYLKWFKFNYCLIGKPKYFIIYKKYIKNIGTSCD